MKTLLKIVKALITHKSTRFLNKDVRVFDKYHLNHQYQGSLTKAFSYLFSLSYEFFLMLEGELLTQFRVSPGTLGRVSISIFGSLSILTLVVPS